MLYPETLEIAADGNTWWACYLKVHQERKTADDFRFENIPHFLPEAKQFDRRRKAFRMKPLFPGYLFIAGDRETLRKAQQCDRVVNVIGVFDQDRFRAELGQVLAAARAGVPLDPFAGLVEGKRCRVVRGPGMGLEGKVIRRGKGLRVAIEVESIGQGFTIEADADQIELLEP